MVYANEDGAEWMNAILSRDITSHLWCTYANEAPAPFISGFAPGTYDFNPHGLYANEDGYEEYAPVFLGFTPDYIAKNPCDHV